jgi:hypothetical protein
VFNGNVPKEMKKQIIARSRSMNIGNGGIFRTILKLPQEHSK